MRLVHSPAGFILPSQTRNSALSESRFFPLCRKMLQGSLLSFNISEMCKCGLHTFWQRPTGLVANSRHINGFWLIRYSKKYNCFLRTVHGISLKKIFTFLLSCSLNCLHMVKHHFDMFMYGLVRKLYISPIMKLSEWQYTCR